MFHESGDSNGTFYKLRCALHSGVFKIINISFLLLQLLFWPVGDDIRSANFSVTEKQTETVLHGLQQDVIYKLRVMGYSRGGDGKKSPTVYFTVLQGIGVCKSYTEFGGIFYPG